MFFRVVVRHCKSGVTQQFPRVWAPKREDAEEWTRRQLRHWRQRPGDYRMRVTRAAA